MAAIHIAGVRGDPCGAVRWTWQSNAQHLLLLPDDDLLRSKHVEVLLCIFMYFNIEISILD